MSDLLGIAGNAVSAYQLALGTVSNNIANVSTDGYSRQSVNLNSATPRQVGAGYIGTGVVYDRIKRQYDAFAELNLRSSSSELASQEPMVDYANRVVDLMGSDNAGLSSALSQFFASARSMATDPASAVLRGEFLRDAQGLASRFGLISSQLDLVDTETREALDSSVSSINTLSQQLAHVNIQLAKFDSVDRQPSELLDQRDRLLRELSQHARLRTTFAPNGVVTVSLGSVSNKDVIVDARGSVPIGLSVDPVNQEHVSILLDPYSKNPTSLAGITSGRLGGLMSFREQVLDGTRNALDSIARVLTNEVNALHRAGVDGYGKKGGDLFAADPSARRLAGGLSVAFDDPLNVAAAAQFRVIEDSNNAGGADATVSYAPPSYPGGPPDLPQVLVNNDHPSAVKAFALGVTQADIRMASVGSIASGLKDVTIYLNDAQGNQQLQLITRDGRHLLGQALNLEAQQPLMGAAGMAVGASYSTDYLGVSGAQGYRDMDIFYGARAEVRRQQAFDSKGQSLPGAPLPAVLTGERLRAGAQDIPAGALTLNGVVLPGLSIPSNGSLRAPAVAAWLNAAVQGASGSQAAAVSGITARASNELRVPVAQLKLDRALVINNTPVVPTGTSFATPQALVDAINSQSASSRVQAWLNSGGELVLTNTQGNEGEDIRIEPVLANGGNALNLSGGVYTGRVELQRALATGQDTPIALGFGEGGKPSMLAALGFRTGAYIKGNVPDDVLVFVTDTPPAGTAPGSGWSSVDARVSATYAGSPVEAATDLRDHPLEITFSTAGAGAGLRYRIMDTGTQTVLAERNFDAMALLEGIRYRGLTIALSSAPRHGDRFVLDGNRDGTGNNDNIRALAGLETAKLFAGGRTAAAAYIDQVNQMGNVARQASIAKDALVVVRDQAEEKRDQVAGVNLDEEAASLIRYQQAYQASAKVMQMASQLFDVMLQMR